MTWVSIVLGGLIVVSVALGLLAARRVPLGMREGRSLWWHPGWWLLVVTAVIYLNQVLFTIYVLRVRHGDPSFIAGSLPAGWFALADHNRLIIWLAARWPAPELLSVSVLRVQAFLELPFVVFAYLLICCWCGPGIYRRAVGMVWLVSVSYTATFCLVEWSLPNPYTVQDIVIRVVSAVLVPLWVSRFTEHDGRRVSSLPDLVTFGVSTAAVGYLVLVVYDTALLYNLGHVGSRWPRAVLAAAMLLAARVLAARWSGRSAGPRVAILARAVGWFLVLFWVPALPIRYGLGFGLPLLAAAAGMIIAVASVLAALREGETRLRDTRARRTSLLIPVAAGVLGGVIGFLASGGYPETRLLASAAGFFVLVLAAAAVCDRVLDPWPSAHR